MVSTHVYPCQEGSHARISHVSLPFSLGIEYLSIRLASVVSDSDFKFHPRCKRLNITHQMFADDLLMCGVDIKLFLLLFQKKIEASGWWLISTRMMCIMQKCLLILLIS